MKRFILFLALSTSITICCIKAEGQEKNPNGSGLYSTLNDYSQHRVSYAIDCSNHKDDLKINELFNASKVQIVHNGEKQSFFKNNLYGYRDCSNNEYRFNNERAYRIADTIGFYLYSLTEYIKQGKAYSTESTRMYFSKSAGEAILPLTIKNLEAAFPENDRFHYAIEEEFKSDKELEAYDNFLKEYKLKYIFRQSLK